MSDNFRWNSHQLRFLEELESGRWEQCTEGYLYLDGGYCCLGVAASMLGVEDEYLDDRYFLDTPRLQTVVDKLGFWSFDGGERDGWFTLARLNDGDFTKSDRENPLLPKFEGKNATFAEIAAMLRADPRRWLREVPE